MSGALPELDLNSWSSDEEAGRDMRARRNLQASTIKTLSYLPKKFNMVSMVDPTLCVHTVNLHNAPDVEAARARSGLPPIDPEDVALNGAQRLALMKCAGSKNASFLAEKLEARWYTIQTIYNFDKAFVKPAFSPSQCLYGVNESYTAGHPVWGYDEPDAFKPEESVDWFDDYRFEYAPYMTYNYNVTALGLENQSAIPLPPTMFDASGWGPFRATYGECMQNPTVDSAIPIVPDEVMLQYMSFALLGPSGAEISFSSISHVTDPTLLKSAYALLALGPERTRPRTTFDPVNEGGDVYDASLLISRELCLTANVAKEGAILQLGQCQPINDITIDQVWSLQPALATNTATRRPKRAAGSAARAGAFGGRLDTGR